MNRTKSWSGIASLLFMTLIAPAGVRAVDGDVDTTPIQVAQGFYGDDYETDGEAAYDSSGYEEAAGAYKSSGTYDAAYDEPESYSPQPRKKRRWWWPFGSSGDEEASEEEYVDDSPLTNATKQRWSGPTELEARSDPGSGNGSGSGSGEGYTADDSGERMRWLKTRYPDLANKEPADVRMRRLLDQARGLKERQNQRQAEFLENQRRFEEQSRRVQEGMGREFEAEDAGNPPTGRSRPRPQPRGNSRPRPRAGRPDRAKQVALAKQKLRRLEEKRQNLIDVGASPEEINKIDAAIGRLRSLLGADARP